MSGNGHVVAPTWTAADFAALEDLNQPLAVDIFQGQRPPVLIDPRGYDQFAYMGDLGNPLIAEAIEAQRAGTRRAQREPDRDWDEVVADGRAITDQVLAAICLEPRYCPKAQLVNGRPPPGQLWWGSFTPVQRDLLAGFWASGIEALKRVREALASHEPVTRPGDGVSPTAEPSPDPARAGVSPVDAGRSGAPLADGAGRSGEGRLFSASRAE